MNAVLTLFVLALAAPAEATPPPAATAKYGRSGVVEPANDNVADDVYDSFQKMFSADHDESVRQTVAFRIKQGRCAEARQFAQAEGAPDLVRMVERTCKPKPQ